MGVEIAPGSRVKLHLKLSLEDGTEALSTLGEPPLECVLGDGTLREGMELALYGLTEGEEQTITLTPEQGWGPRDPALIRELSRSDFPAELSPEVGQIIAFDNGEGESLPGTILEVDETRVKVDFNHPLAGREVIFWVRVLEVE